MQEGNRARFGTTAAGRNDCKLILTGASKKRGEPGLRVRCYCMAPVGSNPYGSFKYGTLGDVFTTKEAVELWQNHKRSQGSQDLADLTEAGPTDIVVL